MAKKAKVIETIPEAESHVYLRFKAGSSDKDYQVHLVKEGSGWVVNFAYGRHGAAMQTGTKTSKPKPFLEAYKTFSDVVKKQQAKGYTTSDTGLAYACTSKEEQVSGLLPQLLNFIPEELLNDYFKNPQFTMQEKKDGRRKLIRKTGNLVEAINRKGLIVGASEKILGALASYDGDFVLDGEDMGDTFYLFDILSLDGKDLTKLSYRSRYTALCLMHPESFGAEAQILPCWTNYRDKVDHFAELRAQGAEGIVLKDCEAEYTVGRPASYRGAPQVKFKFYATAVCTVLQQNGDKRSVSLGVQDSDPKKVLLVPIGNVTIPANHNIPTGGQLVEIRYLHAFPNGGSLYQPVYQGVRDDVDEPDNYTTLKFKQGTQEDDDSE